MIFQTTLFFKKKIIKVLVLDLLVTAKFKEEATIELTHAPGVVNLIDAYV